MVSVVQTIIDACRSWLIESSVCCIKQHALRAAGVSTAATSVPVKTVPAVIPSRASASVRMAGMALIAEKVREQCRN